MHMNLLNRAAASLRHSSLPLQWCFLVMVSLGEVSPARAAEEVASGVVTELRAEIRALESRISELEAQTRTKSTASAPALPSAPPPPLETATEVRAPAASTSAASGQNAFNPAISLILGGRYAQLSEDPKNYRIAGFLPAGDGVGPGARGFNLGESELSLAANVDPYFFANLTLSLSGENTLSVEEAFVRTLALPSGWSVKGGRFFSGLGYGNEVHNHAWDFVDQSLVYQAFFNGQLTQDGVQVCLGCRSEPRIEALRAPMAWALRLSTRSVAIPALGLLMRSRNGRRTAMAPSAR